MTVKVTQVEEEARDEYFGHIFILLKSPSHSQNSQHNPNEADLSNACMQAIGIIIIWGITPVVILM